MLLRIKAEQGVIQFYFRKMLLYEQKFIVVSAFFLIRSGCREIWKNVQNEATKRFSLATRKFEN